jgi:hypothetical protein
MESVNYSSHTTTTLFSQDYGQHNHLGWIYNHSHFYWSFKYPSITYWVILIFVSFHPRQRETEGLVIHPFLKHPNAPLYTQQFENLLYMFPMMFPKFSMHSPRVFPITPHFLLECMLSHLMGWKFVFMIKYLPIFLAWANNNTRSS